MPEDSTKPPESPKMPDWLIGPFVVATRPRPEVELAALKERMAICLFLLEANRQYADMVEALLHGDHYKNPEESEAPASQPASATA